MSYIFILLGILLLIKGGDYLIEGSVVIARRAKLSPMIIGLTVIGFGTSMPELCVSAQAAWTGSPGKGACTWSVRCLTSQRANRG